MTGPGTPTGNAGQYEPQPSDTNLPRPDPTRLTTQLVDRALAAYREIVETRLNAMDTAVQLVATDLVKASDRHVLLVEHTREDIDRGYLALREALEGRIDKVTDVSAAMRELLQSHINKVIEVTAEKFSAVDTRFQERDVRTQQAADESRISLDAALAAAKEAVSEQNKANTEAIRKSELATQKQIDSLVALMATANKAADDKIADLKERLDRAEGQGLGMRESHSESRLNIGQLLLVVSVLAAIAGLVITVVLKA